ncbi:MAG: GNAT family N-acetyltransferase [Thermoleophilia bacterium]
MDIRPVREDDVEPIIGLFRANYGNDYAIPEFYDPQWVKRGIYSDHIIWLVIEDAGRVVGSGACILDFGDYNDQIGEIGRLVVDPNVGGKGLGKRLLAALVDASDDRVEFGFAEARTVHPKTQRIMDDVEMPPLGFLPQFYRMEWRESFVLNGQLFGNGRRLRHPGSVDVIPSVEPLARLSLRNLVLDEPIKVRDDARGYPLDQAVTIEPLTGASLVRLLKIERGRLFDPEVFGGLHVDQGLPHLTARRATYLVATEGERTLGAVGYQFEEHDANVRITELIAEEGSVKGSLLRAVVEQAEQVHQAELIECDVDAANPTIQQTLHDMGLLPAAFVPGMVFHGTHRRDVVRMVKLNVPWDPGPLELVEESRAYFDIVAPEFARASAERLRMSLGDTVAALAGLSSLEAYFFRTAAREIAPAPGTSLDPEALTLVLSGSVRHGDETILAGGCVNPDVLVGPGDGIIPVAGPDTSVLAVSRESLLVLCDRHPRLGMKLYRNLAALRPAWRQAHDDRAL